MAELARGTVSDRPWGRTLYMLAARGLTGQVTLGFEGRRYCLAFHGGAVVGATSPLALDAASRVALTAGLISQFQVADIARRQAAEPHRDDTDLVIEVAGLPAEHAPRLRRRVVAARAARTFAIDRGDFVVHDQIAIPIEQSGLDVRTVVYLGARTHMTEGRLGAEIASIGEWFGLVPGATEHLPQFGFQADAQPILELLGVGATLGELEGASHALDMRTVRAIVYSLGACGMLQSDAQAQPMPEPAAPPIPKSRGPRTTQPATPPAARGLQPMQRTPRPGADPAEAAPPVAKAPSGLQPMQRAPGAIPVIRQSSQIPIPGRRTSQEMTAQPDPDAAPARRHPQLSPPARVIRHPPPPSRGLDGPTLGMHDDPGGGGDDELLDLGLDGPDGEALDLDDAATPPAGVHLDGPTRSGNRSAPPPRSSGPSRPPAPAPQRTQPLPRASAPSSPPLSNIQQRTQPLPTSLRGPAPPQGPASQPQANGFARAKPLARAPVKPEQIAEIQALITSRAKLVDGHADHYALLGVRADALDADIRKAYFALARQLHPDRLSALQIADATRVAQRVLAEVNTAFAVLSDPARRTQYSSILQRGGAAAVRKQDREAEEQALRALDAEEAFRKGENALRGDRIQDALRDLQRAVELAPDEPDYQAVLAWAKFVASPDKAAAAAPTRKLLDAAIRKAPASPTGRLYLGRVERMLGRDQDALKHFRAILQNEPNHREATAEIRVIESRLGGARSKR